MGQLDVGARQSGSEGGQRSRGKGGKFGKGTRK